MAVIELERIAANATVMSIFEGCCLSFLEMLNVTGRKKAVEAVLLVKEPIPAVAKDTSQNNQFLSSPTCSMIQRVTI
jgi:hypothetical protein